MPHRTDLSNPPSAARKPKSTVYCGTSTVGGNQLPRPTWGDHNPLNLVKGWEIGLGNKIIQIIRTAKLTQQ